jgi:hypothetical protein
MSDFEVTPRLKIFLVKEVAIDYKKLSLGLNYYPQKDTVWSFSAAREGGYG